MEFDNKPLVSVIIAFMDEEEYLGEAIESVLQQDYPNFELILVDDGSNNNSTSIAKNYSINHADKVFYFDHFNHENKGVCFSRNLGVEKAKGELVAFLDADDKWLANKLSNQVEIFLKHPDVGMVAEASLYWATYNNPKALDVKIAVGAAPEKVYEPPSLLYQLYPLNKGMAPCPSSWMLTKTAITKVGGFETSFVKKFQLYEDQAFLCKIYLNEQVYISSMCNNLYRQREQSVVKQVNKQGQYHIVRQYFLNWLKEYFEKNNVTNKRLLSLLDKSFLPYKSPLLHLFMYEIPDKIKDGLKKTTPDFIKQLIKKF